VCDISDVDTHSEVSIVDALATQSIINVLTARRIDGTNWDSSQIKTIRNIRGARLEASWW
jgi:hypothetical protein